MKKKKLSKRKLPIQASTLNSDKIHRFERERSHRYAQLEIFKMYYKYRIVAHTPTQLIVNVSNRIFDLSNLISYEKYISIL